MNDPDWPLSVAGEERASGDEGVVLSVREGRTNVSKERPQRSWHLSSAQKRGLSVGLATGLYGISFGALAVVAGLSVWQASALSLLMFTGGSQFAFIGVLGGGGSLGAATAAASLVGVRNAVYGVTANAMLRPRGWRKLVAAQVTIDEAIAVASATENPAEERRGFWTAGIAVFVLWNLFTVLGAVAGNALGDPKAWGLDGAAVAAFLGLLWPRLKARDPIVIAVAAALTTVLVAPFVPPGIPIILAAVVAVILTVAQRSVAPRGDEDPPQPVPERRAPRGDEGPPQPTHPAQPQDGDR